ncbi:hypothetical protein CEY12_18445 [Chryseobacterium sp. T16E-39]|nr:hypothetical protein CEY12_18445 [Chryseobacterium sp. T16E-39]
MLLVNSFDKAPGYTFMEILKYIVIIECVKKIYNLLLNFKDGKTTRSGAGFFEYLKELLAYPSQFHRCF